MKPLQGANLVSLDIVHLQPKTLRWANKVNDRKAWWIGFYLIISFVFLGELIVVFNEYFYRRLGLDRNLILLMLWFFPIIASFIVICFSKERRFLKGLSLILVLSVLGPLAHFISGQLGGAIDFGGLPGLKVTFPIYLVLSSLTIGFGAVLGVLVKGISSSNK